MTLMTRLARLVRADLNAILDRLEAPELVLAQSVREMEQTLAEDRRALAALERELGRIDLRERELAAEEARTAEVLTQGLAGGLAEGQEALARPLVRRRLETARHRAALSARRAEIAAERERQTARIESRGARLADLRARAALYQEDAARDPVDQDPLDTAGPAWSEPGVSEAEVELELLRLRRLGAVT
jgi:phage shock protein A